MSLNPFTLLNQLIIEHGSSVVIKQNLEFLRDQFTSLEKQLAEAKKQIHSQAEHIKQLEKKCNESQAQAAKYIKAPHGVCPYCQDSNVKLVNIEPHPDFGFAMDTYKFICEACKKTWSKDVRRFQ